MANGPLNPPRIHKHYGVHCALNWLYGVPGAAWFLGASRIVFTTTGTLSAAFLVVLPFLVAPKDVGVLEQALKYVYENQLFVCCVLLSIQIVSGFLIWLVECMTSSQADYGKAKVVLNWLVGQLVLNPDHEHTYRATLFKVRRFWGFGRWLGIVARSGETYPKCSTIFSVNPHEKVRNTGIAGECWWRAQNNTGAYFRKTLPEYPVDTNNQELALTYKREGYTDDKEHTNLSVQSCYFHVTVVRKRGAIWGVLVFDSTDATVQPTPRQVGRHDDAMSNAIEVIRLLVGTNK